MKLCCGDMYVLKAIEKMLRKKNLISKWCFGQSDIQNRNRSVTQIKDIPFIRLYIISEHKLHKSH